LRISLRLLDRVLAHAAQTYPAECCGLLVGRGSQVLAVEAARNLRANDRDDRFEIDPLDHVRIFEAARAAGEDIIGCYHSHPDGYPGPSSIDRFLARSFGGPFGYLVVSIRQGWACQVYSGMITEGGQIIPIPLEFEVESQEVRDGA